MPSIRLGIKRSTAMKCALQGQTGWASSALSFVLPSGTLLGIFLRGEIAISGKRFTQPGEA